MLKEDYKTAEIAEALGKRKRWVQYTAVKEGWLCIILNKRGDKRFRLQDLPAHRQKELAAKLEIGSEFLPVLAPGAALITAQKIAGYDPAIGTEIQNTSIQPVEIWPEDRVIDLQAVRDPRVAKWVSIIQEAMTPSAGWKKRAWIENVAQENQTTASYIYNRMAVYEKQGITGLLHRKKNRNQPKAWSTEAMDWWIGLCLKTEHRKLSRTGKRRTLYPLLLAEAEKKSWKVGSYSSALWWLKKRTNPQLLAYQRGGARALDNSLPPILRSYADLSPFEILVGDQHRFDFWVVDEDTGEVFRPEGYFWQDLRTRCFYGAALDRKYDSYLMGLALRMGMQVFGPFKSIYTDHGKPEEAKYIMSVLRDMHGINLHVKRTAENIDLDYDTDPETINPLAGESTQGRHAGLPLHRQAIVRNAKAKMIEGTFNVLENILRNVFKVPGYVKKLGGSQEENEVDEKEIRLLAETGRLFTYRQFFLTVLKAMDWYNREKEHRGVLKEWVWKPKPKRATPMNCLKTCFAQGWRPVKVEREVIDVIFLARDRERTVDRGRITFRNEIYEHKNEPNKRNKLIELSGSQVELRFDPLDPGWVLAFRAGVFVCRADLVEYSSMIDQDLARAKIEEKARRRKGFILEYRRLTSAIPDLRENGEIGTVSAPCLDQAAAALGRGRVKQIERRKVENEMSRQRSTEELALEVAQLEQNQRDPVRPKVLPKRPHYFLTDLDRHSWIMQMEIAGGELPAEDEAFKAVYEAGLTAEQREYLETVRMVNGKL